MYMTCNRKYLWLVGIFAAGTEHYHYKESLSSLIRALPPNGHSHQRPLPSKALPSKATPIKGHSYQRPLPSKATSIKGDSH